MMKKIALINDLSGFGRCSLTAAIPVISALGVQACPLPTAILSAQTGFDSYFYDDYTEKLHRMINEWVKMDETFDGIYSGFLGNASQLESVLFFLENFHQKNTLYIADPIMGDHGQAFPMCTPNFLHAMRTLTQKANVITPNLTELCILADADYEQLTAHANQVDYQKYIIDVAQTLLQKASVEQTIITTGVIRTEADKTLIGNLAITKSDTTYVETPYTGIGFSGTGDLFTSVVSGCLIKGLSIRQALETAARFLQPAIEEASANKLDRNHGVPFEKYLKILTEV